MRSKALYLRTGKKVILANQFGSVVDKVLANPMDQISGGLGWYVGILYTLQIYFDFPVIPIWRLALVKCWASS